MTLDLDDIFKDHVATYESHTDKLETLIWKRPGSSFYAIYYVRWGGTLMVFGDSACATYQWCPDGTEGTTFMRWIAERTNLDYFKGKCVAHPRDGLYYWSEETARKVIKKELEDQDSVLGECGEEPRIAKAFDDLDGLKHLGSQEEWDEWLEDNGRKVFGHSWHFDSTITFPGKTLNPCIRLHHEGLKRAMAQVDRINTDCHHPIIVDGCCVHCKRHVETDTPAEA